MGLEGVKPGRLGVIIGVPVAACILVVLWALSFWARHEPIQELHDLPVHSRIHMAGVVTYVDYPGKRFWIQDETGAVPIPVDPAPAQVHAGQVISVEATKSAPYDSVYGPASVGLRQIKISSSFARIKLPQPLPVALAEFPNADKNGIQIQVSGVVHAAHVDEHGRAQIAIGTSQEEILVLVSEPDKDYSKLVNAEIHVVGVPEQTFDPQAELEHRHVWVASGTAVQVDVRPPSQSQLYSVRGLYLDESVRQGHKVRVQGLVTYSASGSISVEDHWGTIDCELTPQQDIRIGSAVEVEGLPIWDGLRITLTQVKVTPVPLEEYTNYSAVEDRAPELTTARDVRNLTASQAALAVHVRLRGVITYVDPIWHQLFIEDQTSGIYIKYSGHQQMTAGSRVTLYGISHPGNFAPVVVSPRIEVNGTAPLPHPQPVSITKASAGLLDSQYVTIEGVVHPIKVDRKVLHPVPTFELLSELGQVHVTASPDFPDLQHTREFEDARVRIQGVLGTVFNSRRQLIGYQLQVQKPSQITVLEPSDPNPFGMETTPIENLLRFSNHMQSGHRVKVAGVVTLVDRDHLFLQDATSGVEIKGDTRSIHLGEWIEAIGYPTLVGHYSPVMTDAAFRRDSQYGHVVPKKMTVETILQGQQESMLVSVEGRLLMVLDEPGRKTLVLQSGVRTFSAQLNYSDGGADLSHLRQGSTLLVTGVCAAQVEANKLFNVVDHDPTEFRILLRMPADVAVVHPASIWSMQTMLVLLSAVALLVPSILIWVLLLRRRVHIQMTALQEAEETGQAIKDLLRSMRSISKEQRFDTKVSVRGSEDVVQLVIGFNRMLGELQQRELEKRSAEAKLQKMAMLDELTGLPNRRMLFDRLEHSLATAERQKHMLALLYIDLDGFKIVNDNMGHNLGDSVLAEVAQRLKSRARKSDTLARIGGDEFTLILDKIANVEVAENVAREILESLTAPFLIENQTIRVGASIGISIYPDHGTNCIELLQQADCAMYAAKHNGKSRIVQFGDELGKTARTRMTLESELRRAVAEDAIVVHYQPEFSVASNSIVRFEALARWSHETLGQVSPSQFIPIAEETGLIVPLGAQVLERACKDALEWNRLASCEVQVAVNVSSVQLSRDSFVSEVEATLRRTGLRPDLLQIELTESATMARLDRTANIMKRLKALGVSVVLDDFGTGYSCLSYLPLLPFDALKIDRSFMNELLVRPESIALMRSVIAMAHNLNMGVIVEGIETKEELQQIILIGADETQGFLQGAPSANPLGFLQQMAATGKAEEGGIEVAP